MTILKLAPTTADPGKYKISLRSYSVDFRSTMIVEADKVGWKAAVQKARATMPELFVDEDTVTLEQAVVVLFYLQKELS